MDWSEQSVKTIASKEQSDTFIADTPLVVRGVLPRPIAGDAEQITDLGVSDQDRPECSHVPGVSRGQAKSDNTVQSVRKENRRCAGAEMLRRTALS